ncbi:hypothetical protein GLOTRDRAFT_132582 [Gloeophyllum trabeum ATCC 11539]|uniref:Uncharacterized protein n=1 Tax=Gloeophyllum trabeum (strain ATCC 11539 / FP-39264 / Madison 617) TaxID=670483 RepID=S7RBY7_GLOTA|nr:uncharacterized protein GLOTRDRAFT_132582 [Gloeophyllum trabeum ATCC 11539]EPQ51765.1 hypothetical protein GLOTRDRAFT_132582 [Gloeophyllum trabeum ATCC 11539]
MSSNNLTLESNIPSKPVGFVPPSDLAEDRVWQFPSGQEPTAKRRDVVIDARRERLLDWIPQTTSTSIGVG